MRTPPNTVNIQPPKNYNVINTTSVQPANASTSRNVIEETSVMPA